MVSWFRVRGIGAQTLAVALTNARDLILLRGFAEILCEGRLKHLAIEIIETRDVDGCCQFLLRGEGW